ncbi:hypothetical protein PHYPSEUDO_010147 [Phytophthora pseudosyringae]|uniref:Uncharacterized protein n=1 Tax=Phytophthora pseudosyringae TaxID=221518 RepID=A0A8T1VBI0_9STRA|nr:hypothetical protein PHYPSEUDO_010147 [Phytophthora pseudosyringae]
MTPLGLPRSEATAHTLRGKKRVRRIHIELSFYRQQVQELELQLKRLELHKAQSGTPLKQRLRAEEQHKELCEKHAIVAKLSTELLKLLEKCGNDENFAGCLDSNTQPRFLLFSTAADDKIVAEQLANVARLRLELKHREYQAPIRTVDFSWGLSRGNLFVKRDPTVLLEVHCRTTVPFNLEVATRAYWRLFCVEHGEKDSAADVSANTITRSFSLRLEFEGLVSEASGRYTCQTHVEDDKVTITWVEHADVSEFGGVIFNGMQYQKRACMILRRVPREGPAHQSTSTVVDTYFQTTPILHDSVPDKLQQTQAFINSAHRSHSKLNKVVCQHMSNLLLEEDWKATFG